MEINLIEPKILEIQSFDKTLADKSTALAGLITNEETLKAAVEAGKEIDRALKAREEWFEPIVSQAHKTWKTLTGRREDVLAPLRRAKLALSSAIGHFKSEQERKRREAEAKVQAELKKLEEENRLRVAEELEKAGQGQAAEALIDAPIVTPPVVLPKIETDSHTRTNWKFRIVNVDLIPRFYLIVDEKRIGQIVRANKDKTSIPGIEIYEEKMEVFR